MKRAFSSFKPRKADTEAPEGPFRSSDFPGSLLWIPPACPVRSRSRHFRYPVLRSSRFHRPRFSRSCEPPAAPSCCASTSFGGSETRSSPATEKTIIAVFVRREFFSENSQRKETERSKSRAIPAPIEYLVGVYLFN